MYVSSRRIPGGVFAVCVFLSLFFHFASFSPAIFKSLFESHEQPKKHDPVQIKIVQKPASKKDSALLEQDLKKEIVEVPLEPTEAPETSKFAGLQDHKAKKQTRLAERLARPKAANAGRRGEQVTEKPSAPKAEKKELSLADFAKNPSKRSLDNLIPTMNSGNPNAGYFDFIADTDIKIGDILDLNTTRTEFVGFFTHFRKALQLVWTYPSDAAKKGLEGVVGLNIIFKKDGTPKSVNLRKSSGSKILDDSIVEAIWLAQPYGALPSTYEKETLTVTANFHYHLRAAH